MENYDSSAGAAAAFSHIVSALLIPIIIICGNHDYLALENL